MIARSAFRRKDDMSKALLDIDDGIATITFNSPQNFNALDDAMLADMLAAVRAVEVRDDIRVVVFRGAGKAFCAGGDIARFAVAGDKVHDIINAYGPGIQYVVHWMRHTRAIVVAVVHGAVAGGGIGLMLAADVVIAAEDTTVAIAYARLGTSPDAGTSYFLARTLGYRKALELYLMSERLDGKAAQELGLINFTAPAASLEAEADTLIRRLAAGPAVAYGSAKRLFRQAADTALHQHLDDEIRLFSDNTRHPDFAEGVRAFLEKRPPKFGIVTEMEHA
jgi:2-(1,2-epoxy-1,2-dihydrophenyl)acetyl-CoA isomerase